MNNSSYLDKLKPSGNKSIMKDSENTEKLKAKVFEIFFNFKFKVISKICLKGVIVSKSNYKSNRFDKLCEETYCHRDFQYCLFTCSFARRDVY